MELCTALIDQWRPETNTFHMYHGEMTITLEDVSFITSLPVDGGAVFQEYPPKDYDWDAAIFRILGGSFLLADRSGSVVHPVYLLLLEQERPSDTEYYAWGAASLAWLYREMGRSIFNLEGHGKAWGNIGGWMVLLQAWALERFPSITQRTHDDRRRGPDGEDYPRLRRYGLELNRTLF
ncbi:Protein MAINTENANCE OF MERISTEMS [Linum grandiflorum]